MITILLLLTMTLMMLVTKVASPAPSKACSLSGAAEAGFRPLYNFSSAAFLPCDAHPFGSKSQGILS